MSSGDPCRTVSRPADSQLRSTEGNWGTNNDPRNAFLGIAIPLDMLRDGYENAWGQSHVEDSVALFAIVLDFHDVLVELLEWFILVILSSKIRASLAESLKLFFNLLCRRLDVGSDPLEVFLVVHFRSGISDNLDVFWKEFVPVL